MIIQVIKNVVAKLEALEPAWFRANSWINESVGGILESLPFIYFLGPVWGLLGFTAFSLSYELWFDPWGWSEDDFGQRQAGALLVAYLWVLLR